MCIIQPSKSQSKSVTAVQVISACFQIKIYLLEFEENQYRYLDRRQFNSLQKYNKKMAVDSMKLFCFHGEAKIISKNCKISLLVLKKMSFCTEGNKNCLI